MAGLRTIKAKFKKFFSTKQASTEGVELLRKFILPYARECPERGMSVDDVLTQFFAVNDRLLVYARAKRDFKIPGGLYITGRLATKTHGQNLWVKEKQVVLLAIDRIDERVRMEVVIEGKELNFRLDRHEFETVIEWLEVIEDDGAVTRYRNNRVKPVERPNNSNRNLGRPVLRKRAGKRKKPRR